MASGIKYPREVRSISRDKHPYPVLREIDLITRATQTPT